MLAKVLKLLVVGIYLQKSIFDIFILNIAAVDSQNSIYSYICACFSVFIIIVILMSILDFGSNWK